jgi:hypothetical protein
MKTTMTLGDIRSHGPCADGWEKLVASCGTDDPGHTVSLIDILNSNGLEHALWAVRCLPRRERVSLGLAFATPVQHLHPAAAKCNAATRRWLAGEATDDELDDAARAADAAVWAADAAWAAADAAAADAAWAAADAAAARAWAAAARAAASAAWAASAAAWAAGIPYDAGEIMRQWCAEHNSDD